MTDQNSQPMNETPTSPSVDGEADDMLLYVALSFADHPRPRPTLQAPADTMDELREALRVLAKAYRAALSRSEAPVAADDEEMIERVEGILTLLKTWKEVEETLDNALSTLPQPAAVEPKFVKDQAHRNRISPSGGLTSVEAAKSPALDPATVEACAKVVDQWTADITKAGDQFDKGGDIYAHANISQGIAAAIRDLAGKDGA